MKTMKNGVLLFLAFSFLTLSLMGTAAAQWRICCGSFRQCCYTVQQSYSTIQTELNNTRQALGQVMTERDAALAECKEITAERDRLAAQLAADETQNEELVAKRDEYEKALKEKNALLEKLETQQTEQEKRITELEASLSEAQSLLEELKPTLERTESFVAEQNARIEQLNDELKKLVAEKGDSEAFNAKIAELKEIVGRKKQLVEELTAEQTEGDSSYSQLNAEVKDLIKKRIETENRLIEVEIVNSKVERENLDLVSENANLRDMIDKQKTEIDSLRTQVATLRQRYEKIKASRDTLQSDYDALLAALDDVKNKEEALQKINAFKNNIAVLTKERDEALEQNQILTEKLAANQSVLDKIQQDQLNLGKRFAVLSQEYGTYKTLTDEQVSDYMKRLDELKKQFDETVAEKIRLEGEGVELKKEIEDSKTVLGSFDLFITSISDQVNRLGNNDYDRTKLYVVGIPIVILILGFLLILARTRHPKRSTIQEAFDSYQNQVKF